MFQTTHEFKATFFKYILNVNKKYPKIKEYCNN